jgi:hypothetical protein
LWPFDERRMTVFVKQNSFRWWFPAAFDSGLQLCFYVFLKLAQIAGRLCVNDIEVVIRCRIWNRVRVER